MRAPGLPSCVRASLPVPASRTSSHPGAFVSRGVPAAGGAGRSPGCLAAAGPRRPRGRCGAGASRTSATIVSPGRPRRSAGGRRCGSPSSIRMVRSSGRAPSAGWWSAFARLYWFLRPRIRYDIHQVFLTLGCVLICRRRLTADQRRHDLQRPGRRTRRTGSWCSSARPSARRTETRTGVPDRAVSAVMTTATPFRPEGPNRISGLRPSSVRTTSHRAVSAPGSVTRCPGRPGPDTRQGVPGRTRS